MTSEPFQPDLVSHRERLSPANLLITSPKLLEFSHSPATSPVTPGSLISSSLGNAAVGCKISLFFWVYKAPQALSLLLVWLKVVQENHGCSRFGMVQANLHLPHAHREDVKVIPVKPI